MSAGGSGSEELGKHLPLESCDSWIFVKENPDRKKKEKQFPLKVDKVRVINEENKRCK